MEATSQNRLNTYWTTYYKRSKHRRQCLFCRTVIADGSPVVGIEGTLGGNQTGLSFSKEYQKWYYAHAICVDVRLQAEEALDHARPVTGSCPVCASHKYFPQDGDDRCGPCAEVQHRLELAAGIPAAMHRSQECEC